LVNVIKKKLKTVGEGDFIKDHTVIMHFSVVVRLNGGKLKNTSITEAKHGFDISTNGRRKINLKQHKK
jgi:hypothetical protein